MNGPRLAAPAAVALGALLLLPACSARKPIVSDPPEVRTEASVRGQKHLGPSAKPAQAKPAPQPKTPEDTSKDTVVAEMKDAKDTDAQVKDAVAKAEAREKELRAGIEEQPTPAVQQPAAPAEAKPEAKAAAAPAKAESPAPAADSAKKSPSGDALPASEAPSPAPEAAQAEAKAPAERQAAVQIASFSTEKNAESALAWLKDKGYTQARVVSVDQGGTVYHRVQAGPFQDLAAARKALEELKASWPQAFIPAD
jgi:cell division septation protein DedD